jgi:hypothetical protein
MNAYKLAQQNNCTNLECSKAKMYSEEEKKEQQFNIMLERDDCKNSNRCECQNPNSCLGEKEI